MKRVEGCVECSRLWSDFAGIIYRVEKFRGRLRVATLAHEQGREQLLAPELRKAEQEKMDAKVAIERHEAEAHGGMPHSVVTSSN